MMYIAIYPTCFFICSYVDHILVLFLCNRATTRNYPAGFGRRLADLWESLVKTKAGMPSLPPQVPSAKETFESLVFCDLWAEAHMQSVCHWLRGGRDLKIPDAFRSSLPRRL